MNAIIEKVKKAPYMSRAKIDEMIEEINKAQNETTRIFNVKEFAQFKQIRKSLTDNAEKFDALQNNNHVFAQKEPSQLMEMVETYKQMRKDKNQELDLAAYKKLND